MLNPLYKGHDGTFVELLCVARHTESLEKFAVFKYLNSELFQILEAEKFFGLMNIEGESVQRFTLV